jgi:hypothetical protein
MAPGSNLAGYALYAEIAATFVQVRTSFPKEVPSTLWHAPMDLIANVADQLALRIAMVLWWVGCGSSSLTTTISCARASRLCCGR